MSTSKRTVTAIVKRVNRGAKRAEFTLFLDKDQRTCWLNYKDLTSDRIHTGAMVKLSLDEQWLAQAST